MFWILGVAVLGLILAAPIRLSVRVTGEGRPNWGLEAVWFRILRAGIDSGGSYFALGKRRYRFFAPATGADSGAKEPMGESWRAFARRWQSAADEDVRIDLRLLRDGWQAVRVAVRGDCRLGFDDPALGAWVQGAFYAGGLAERNPAFNLEVDFMSAGFWGTAAIGLEVRLLDMIVPAGRFGEAKLVQFVHRKYRRGKAIWQV